MGLNEYLLDENGELYNNETFSLAKFMAVYPKEVLESSEGRRAITKYNPLLFMLLYSPHVMKSEQTSNMISINDLNIILCKHALDWCKPKNVPKRPGLRKAYLSPRGSSKSSTMKCLMIWALAHQHLKYIMMFSGSDSQAIRLLGSIKTEFDGHSNKLLALDFPELCQPSRKPGSKIALADRTNIYKAASEVTIEARSVTSSVLGAKEGDTRPDLLYLDDVSRAEGTSSVYQEHQRLEVILGTLLPLSDTAVVVYTGTNHMPGSIADDLIHSCDDSEESADWIKEEGFICYWMKPLVDRSDGSRRSMWRQRWTVEQLESWEGDRAYSKNFMNHPLSADSGDWFQYNYFVVEKLPSVSRRIISIDPGVSTKATSDPSGVAVISFSFAARKACVDECMAVKLKSTGMQKLILELLEKYPDVTDILYETNQGGENLMEATLPDVPINVVSIFQTNSKMERAELLLTRYRRGHIVHAKKFGSYEAELMSLPHPGNSPNMTDSVGTAIEWLAKAGRRTTNPLRHSFR